MTQIKNLHSYEIITTHDNEKELHVEIKGDLKHMPKTDEPMLAIYGTWQRTGNRTLLYTQHIHVEDTMNEIESALQDDYNALLSGNLRKVI
jgi:hypothetical protein